MINYFSLLLLIFSVSLIDGMELNGTEKNILLRQVNLRSILQTALEKEKNQGFFQVYIEEVFSRIEALNDGFVGCIFTAIDSIENERCYQPELIRTYDCRYVFTQEPTNYLGKYTRYYWIDDARQSIRVELEITNSQIIKNFLNN